MKIVIDTKDIAKYYSELDSDFDEWYAPTNYMLLSPVISLLKHLGKNEAASELEELLK